MANYTPLGLANFEEIDTRKGFFKKIIFKLKGRVDPSVILKQTIETSDDTTLAPPDETSVIADAIGIEASPSMRFDESLSSPVDSTKLSLSSSFANKRHHTLTDRRYWMMDENCKQCFECGSRFTAIRRKHHCRVCGRIFCHQCSCQFVEGYLLGLTGLQRVCNFCASSFQPDRLNSTSTITNAPASGSQLSPSVAQPGSEQAHTERRDLWLRLGQNATRPLFSNSTQPTSTTAPAVTLDDCFKSNAFPVPSAFAGSPYLSTPCPTVSSRASPLQSQCSTGITWTRSISDVVHPGVAFTSSYETDKPSESKLIFLWSSILNSCDDSIHPLADSEHLHSTTTFESNGFGCDPKLLPLFTVVHESRTRCCTSGLNLVYWLVNNVQELNQSRTQARSICQRFVDLGLLTPVNSDACATFRDDFTVYELKQLPLPTVSTTRPNRRLSWPRDVSTKQIQHFEPPFTGLSGEPEWLQQIENRTPKHPTPDPSITECAESQPTVRPPGYLEHGSRASLELGVQNVLTDANPFGAIEVSSTERIPLSRPSPESAPYIFNPVALRSRLASLETVSAEESDSASTLRTIHDEHLFQIIRQDVRDHQLDNSWTTVIYRLCRAVCNSVRFDLRTAPPKPSYASLMAPSTEDTRRPPPIHYSPLDIRHYVHIKKLVTNDDGESVIFHGVVFSKRAAQRIVFKELRNPRILILAGCIDYQRTPSKLTQLESQIMQEEEYLSNCVSKLLRLHPNVLIVGGSVSHVAKTQLIKAGIVFFCNVKRSVLLRISRITGSDILDSVDRLVGDEVLKSGQSQRLPTHLGVSQQVKVEEFCLANGTPKFFTFINNSATYSTHRPVTSEVTVLLRGDDLSTLKRVKHCLLFALVVGYNRRLELSYAADAGIYRIVGPSEKPVGTPVKSDQDTEPHPTDLALYLHDHRLTISPLTNMSVPYLASLEGQFAPLNAYYTYVFEWPFTRRLNDLLKRRLKIVRSELYALQKEKHAVVRKPPSPQPQSRHSFLDQNFVLGSEKNTERNCIYADFKARAYYSASTRLKPSPLVQFWSDFCSLFDGKCNALASLRENLFDSSRSHLKSTIRTSKELPKTGAVLKDDHLFTRRVARSILDPRSHQVFSFLTTIFSHKSPFWPEPCVPPWIASVEFYSPQDLPLGLFLERCCFTHKPCRHPHCEFPMSEHVQRFVQTRGSVQLYIRSLPQDTSKPPGDQQTNHLTRPDSRIVMWLFCTTCGQSSVRRWLSGDAWHYSFAKFLDTIINTATTTDRAVLQSPSSITHNDAPEMAVPANNPQLPCPHSAYQSLQHCFALERRLAIFKFHPVTVFEVVMPSNEIRIFPSSELAAAASFPNAVQSVNCIPDYLYAEAFDVWQKYYRTRTAVKAHLVTLLHDNASPDLNAFLSACINLFETDGRRDSMELRAELLSFFIRRENDLASLSRLLNHATLKGGFPDSSAKRFKSDSESSDACGEINDFEFPNDPQSASSSTPLDDLGVQLQSPVSEYLSEYLLSLDAAEKAAIVQNLINQLKRWLFCFVTFWNSRCAEYDVLLKRSEKLAKELRQNYSTTSNETLQSKFEHSETETRSGTSRYPSSSALLEVADSRSQVQERRRFYTFSHSNQAEISNFAQDIVLSQRGSKESLPELRSKSSSSSVVEQDLSTIPPCDSRCSVSESLKDISLDARVTFSVGADIVTYEKAAFVDVKRPNLEECPSLKSNPTKVPSLDDFTQPKLDDATPRVRSSTESTVQAAASAATIPLTVPTGMRRFIHTLLPPGGHSCDSKAFPLPVAAHEHPQLGLNEDLLVLTSPNELSGGALSSVPNLKDNIESTKEFFTTLSQQLRLNVLDVYVNDRELTSIVAYALSTPDYERNLVDLHSTIGNQNAVSTNNNNNSSANSSSKDHSAQLSPQRRDKINVTSKETKSGVLEGDALKCDQFVSSTSSTSVVKQSAVSFSASDPSAPPPVNEKVNSGSNKHIKIQFSDCSTNFFCCIFYASEFFRLRQLVLPQGDVGFIRSLSRCYQWDARGGKSGSLFMKTRDERFVVKELSAIEMKTFHEVSQNYFEYLIGAALEQRLCLLSRILGIFHVGFRNNLTGEAHRFDVLVMENLFHDRVQLAAIYDLKGSLRKRLVEEYKVESETEFRPTGRANGRREADRQQVAPVLLDQNLLNASVDDPLYLRVHSKNALSHCLTVDTEFLANLFIMDYSLLVGVDRLTNQLVIGLIDYMRKFTFDKRVEMMIKQTITSAQAPPPTILTPDLYRERFLMQMDNYFPLVPDQWYDSVAEHAEVWDTRRAACPSESNQPN